MTRYTVLAALFIAMTAGAAEDFGYVDSAASVKGAVVIDARPIMNCRARSLDGARCLPAGDFLGPHKRLPSARDLLWLLGAAGFKGDETILVVGQEATARDFVAGLLYVAGQRKVQVLSVPMDRVLESGVAAGQGRERGMIRETVFAAPMRDDLLVLRDELRAIRPMPVLLDGRTDGEYWGERARVARSGHLPGAISLPAQQLRVALGEAAKRRPVLPQGNAVAYAHDAFEGMAYLTLLYAGYGVPVRLYAEGWSEWAADGSLPADAVAYPERNEGRSAEKQYAPVSQPPWGATMAVALAFALTAFAVGWILARRRTA